MSRRLLCLDFDGVLHSYKSGWVTATFIPDPPVRGAINFLHTAVQHFNVCIFSSRSEEPGGIQAMSTWIQYWTAQEAGNSAWANQVIDALCLPFCEKAGYEVWPKTKPAAFLTIDDRAWTFDGNWPAVGDMLAFKPWNKR